MNQKSMTRQKFLRAAGGLIFLAAFGGIWRASDEGVFSSGSGPAYEPWLDWQSGGDPDTLRLVRAAILAANAHNPQPWLFHVTETCIDVFVDPTRNIGAMDPLRREMYIGVGCAIENLYLAAAPNEYTANVTLMPDANSRTHAARVELSRGPRVVSFYW